MSDLQKLDKQSYLYLVPKHLAALVYLGINIDNYIIFDLIY